MMIMMMMNNQQMLKHNRHWALLWAILKLEGDKLLNELFKSSTDTSVANC